MRVLGFTYAVLASLIGLLGGARAHAATNATPWLMLPWSSDDGLPNNSVGGVAQTVDGFLWIGTPNGLTRFDGLKFEDVSLTNFIAMPNRGILTMISGRGGDLHLGMDRGAVVSLSSGQRRVFLPDVETAKLTINSMMEDSQGAVWVGYRSGIVGRIVDGKMTQFGEEDGFPPGTEMCSLACDAQGRVWFIKAGQLGIWRDGKFDVLQRLGDGPARLAVARNGGVWVCSNFRMYKYDEGEELQYLGKFEPRLPSSEPTVIKESRDGSVWIATTFTGLLRFSENQFEVVPTSHQEILSLLEDAQGNIWVGTSGGGLNQVKPRAISLETTDAGLPFVAVRSMTEDSKGVIWAATQNGALARKVEGRWQVLPTDTNWFGDAMSVCADAKGDLWVGTRTHRLLRWREDRFVPWGDVSQVIGQTIHTVVVSTNGDIWLGEETPTAIQRIRDGKAQSFQVPPDIRVIRASAEDANGTVWFGTSGGVLLRTDGDRLVDETARTAGARQPIRSLYATPDGSLWIAYAGWGVGRIKNGRFTMINARQGLHDDFVSQIIADDRGRFWFGGDRGIFKVNQQELNDVADGKLPRLHSVRYGPGDYGQTEGQPSLQANFGSSPIALRSRDGRLWLPMRTALAVVDPEKLRESSSSPTVWVTQMMVGEEPAAKYGGVISPPTIGDKKIVDLSLMNEGMKLPPDHRRVEFIYTALSFAGAENVTFSYRLEGVDEGWTETRDRKAVYPRLLAGDYKFRVKACNSEGVWNDLGATVAFEVLPFFWNTWWFRSTAGIVFTVVVIAFVRQVFVRRLRLQVRALEAQAALHKERARIAKDIHDDLGASLTQISLIGELAHQDKVNPEKVAGHINTISTTARRAVKSLDEIVWAVNPRNDTLAHFIDYTGQFALDYLRVAGVRCRLNLPEHVPDRELSTDVRHNLFLVVKEAINNTVKYARASELRLWIAVTDEKLELTIEDNGVGFEQPADDPGADGLRNMHQRMMDIGGQCWIQGRPGSGAKITLELPWSADGKKSNLNVCSIAYIKLMSHSDKQEAEVAKERKMPINVAIVEDSRGTRESLTELLNRSPRLHCLGAYPNGETALRELPERTPDVVLMDINLPGMSGIECVARLKQKTPKTLVLMLTTYEEGDLIFESLRAGANGYLLKNMPPSELVEAVEEVHSGGSPMSMHIARKVVNHFHQIKQPSSEMEKLTKREREILALLAKGFLYKEIGDQLSISLSTVRAHLHAVYEKLHVQSRTEAVVKYLNRS